MFGDIIKVTPTSKVVGDMALTMVTSALTPEAVLDANTEIAFPESVVQLFRGELGQPLGGFPPALQAKILAGAELASSLMYPKIFREYAADPTTFGDLSMLPTSVFFFGMRSGQEINIDLERGKTLIVRYVTTSDVHDDGTRTVFFELNGQPRPLRIVDRSQVAKRPAHPKAEAGNSAQVGAPMPGTVATVLVHVGQPVERGAALITLEAMKMETTVRADREGTIKEVLVKAGMQVDTKDLLVVFA